jgi:hypothetical protein
MQKETTQHIGVSVLNANKVFAFQTLILFYNCSIKLKRGRFM